MRVNRDTFEIEASSLEIPGLQRPIAVDAAGIVHVEVARGVVALDATTLTVLGRSAYANLQWASWHPELRAVVIVEQRGEHDRVHLIRWQPEPWMPAPSNGAAPSPPGLPDELTAGASTAPSAWAAE